MTVRKKATKTKKASRNPEIVIPDKLYFRIGEVASLCRLPAYVLRFWETEFPQLKPVKSSTGQRMYRKRDVESVVRIKKLLYEDGFTIAGARVQLRDEIKSERSQTALPFPVNPTPNVALATNSSRFSTSSPCDTSGCGRTRFCLCLRGLSLPLGGAALQRCDSSFILTAPLRR